MVVTEAKKLRLLSEPIKQRLLAEFAEPATPRKVMQRLGMSGKGIYRHIDQLLEADFLFVVSTRPTRGTIERTLQTSARQFSAHLGESPASGTWTDFANALIAAANNRQGEAMLAKANMRIPAEAWPAIVEEFTAMLQRHESESGETYSVHLVFTPFVE